MLASTILRGRSLGLALATLPVACGSDDGSRQSDTAYTSVTTASTNSGESDSTAGATSSASGTLEGSSGSDSVGSAESDASDGPGSSSGAPTSGNTSGNTSESTGGPNVCDGVGSRELIPPRSCDGPSGNTSTELPPNGLFSTSWFGCYLGDDGEIVQDPSDNCEFACGPQGLCDAAQSGPECEAELKWFAADADRFGCGGRVLVTNCENGNAVVLVTLDRGPNCGVEMDCATPVLDMSHDAMVYLFDGGIFGGCDQQVVVVTQVDEATPLGPV